MAVKIMYNSKEYNDVLEFPEYQQKILQDWFEGKLKVRDDYKYFIMNVKLRDKDNIYQLFDFTYYLKNNKKKIQVNPKVKNLFNRFLKGNKSIVKLQNKDRDFRSFKDFSKKQQEILNILLDKGIIKDWGFLNSLYVQKGLDFYKILDTNGGLLEKTHNDLINFLENE